MLEVKNVKVYGLEESVIACRNAMRLEMPEYTKLEFDASYPRATKLAMCGGGSGHSTFRVGIVVQFDLKYPNYISPELQRYHFLDIVTSSSKMHKLVQMDMDACFNEYVCIGAKEMMKELLARYNKDKSYENFIRLLSNCPLGIELFMRCSTNYEQLATIYKQRKDHKLKEWHIFCDWIANLPFAHQLIIGDTPTISDEEFNLEMKKL